jgi:VWFA-related protein
VISPEEVAMRRTWALIFVLLGVCSTAWAQDPQRGPTFRGGIEVIEIDVSAVDGDGRPVTDMLGPEFTVTVDGRPRKVLNAEFISSGPPPGFRANAADKPEAPFSSNAAAGRGRLVLIAVDRDSITFGDGRHVAAAAERFLDALAPEDKVGFLTVPMPGPFLDFTTNHALLRKSFSDIVGLSHRPETRFNVGVYEAFAITNHSDALVEQRALDRACGGLRPTSVEYQTCQIELRAQASGVVTEIRYRVRNSTDAIESILQGLIEVEGTKSLVWITEGLVIEGAGGELAALERLSAAARTTVNIIMIDQLIPGEISERVQSPTLKQDRDLEVRGLELLASMTRGALFRVSANPDAAFRRISDELSGYYLLAVEAEPTDRNGQRHPIKVSVRRRGVTLRSRREFQVVTETVAAKESTDARLARTLRSPFAATELPLRLATYAYQDPDSAKVRVLVATEIEHTSQNASDVVLGYVLTNRDGKVALSGTQKATLTPVEGLQGPLLEHASTFTIEPGSYMLKVAAVNGEGKRGSVEHPLQAWQMQGVPFAIGDLMLADNPPAASGSLRPPVEARLSAGRLAAYLEMYANQPEFFSSVQVRLEVAANETGPALASGVAEPAVMKDPKSRVVLVSMSLGELPPGQYVARAIVTRGSEKVGQLSRPFHITQASAAARVAPGGSGTAAAGSVAGGAPSLLRTMLPPTAPFERNDLLKSEVVGFFMDVLDRGRPALKSTTALVRSGKMEGTGLQALESGDQLAATFLRGLELYSKGDLNQAATQFSAALRVSPDFAPASFYLGACYAAAGRDKDAATAWRRALLGPDKTSVEYAALGDALMRLGDPQQAIAPLAEAVAKWPEDDEVRRRLALAYAAVPQHKDALATIEPYLAKHPTDHEALLIATHAIYASTLQGQPLMGEREDRERMDKYARAYAAAKGPHASLVTTWAGYVKSKAESSK